GLGGNYVTFHETNGEMTNGYAILDADFVHATLTAPDPRTATGVDEIQALYLHELGHALGLGHTSDRMQIMYPTIQGNVPARLGAGDLAGLKALSGGSCWKTASYRAPGTPQ